MRDVVKVQAFQADEAIAKLKALDALELALKNIVGLGTVLTVETRRQGLLLDPNSALGRFTDAIGEFHSARREYAGFEADDYDAQSFLVVAHVANRRVRQRLTF